MRFLLDEHLSPRIAEIARGSGLDVASVSQLGARGLSDEQQLTLAASEGRCFVTRDRADYIILTRQFFAEGRSHAGVVLIPSSLPTNHFTGIARALLRFAEEHADAALAYSITYLRRTGEDESGPVAQDRQD